MNDARKSVLGRRSPFLLWLLLASVILPVLITLQLNTLMSVTTIATRDTVADPFNTLERETIDIQHHQFIKRNLTFLHIPKTGGSSIVKASIPANLTWGDCLFRNHTLSFHCSAFSAIHRPCSHVTWDGCTKHLPMQHIQRVETTKNNVQQQQQQHCNPYAGSDVLVVVRNPFDRVLSEFYYNCLVSKLAKCQRQKIYENAYVNEAIQKRVKWRKNSCYSPSKHRCYFANCNHDIPQYDYVYDYVYDDDDDDDDKGKRRRRLVKWVLHLETLQDEFPKLLRRYGLEDVVRLPKQRVNAGDSLLTMTSKSTSGSAAKKKTNYHRRLTVANLTRETRELIALVYAKDFEAFGYSKQLEL